MNRSTDSIILLAVMGSIWGIQPALVKLATVTDMSESDILAIGLFGLSIAFAIFLIAKRKLFRITPRRLFYFTGASCLGIIAPFIVRIAAAPHLPVSLMALIVCTTPVLTLTLSLILRSEELSKRKVTGVLIGLLASIIVLFPDLKHPDTRHIFWAGIMFLIPISYALSQQFIHSFWPDQLTPIQVAAGENIMSGILFLPFYIMLSGTEVSPANWGTGHLSIIGWTMLSLIEISIFFTLIKKEGPTFVSFGTFIAIASSGLWGFLIFDESIPSGFVISAALLATSMLLIRKRN